MVSVRQSERGAVRLKRLIEQRSEMVLGPENSSRSLATAYLAKDVYASAKYRSL